VARNPYSPPESPISDKEPSRAVEPPQPVIWAVWLMRASIVLGYSALFVGPDITRDLGDMTPEARTAGVGFFFVVLALMALLYLWLIQKVKVGRNWARLVMLGLTVFGIISVLRSSGIQPPLSLAMNAIDTLIDVAAMVLLFRPPGSTWFRPQT
jgi:hypothetical protein